MKLRALSIIKVPQGRPIRREKFIPTVFGQARIQDFVVEARGNFVFYLSSTKLAKKKRSYHAEVYAILACGLENPKRAPKGRTIQICSDGRAALLAIESSKVESRLVLECKKTLNDLASRNKVIITWVPGHLGVRGNEKTDRLAR
ncbi:hypothetical protein NQ317_007320 [Molorchus minor]|uniref:RNase H type-1 domain-containing protein n=1 Tax=Molorchus minor TaxID=1323400 RepID=A0ABQ9J9C6_9CUCU|nr:hypothetical protein NQ317_007320 [Molorchus minor]